VGASAPTTKARNKGIVAIANKLARIALFKGEEYRHSACARARKRRWSGGKDAALKALCASHFSTAAATTK
jgi:hypothetical protein